MIYMTSSVVPVVGNAERSLMRVNDPAITEKMVRALTDSGMRKVLNATVVSPKSAAALSEELGIPIRSIYRYISDLSELGLLTSEQTMLIDSGGKYLLYRSMVKQVGIAYDSEKNVFNVDIVPNENILGKFMRFWTYMGGN